MLFQFRDTLDKRLGKFDEGSKEKTFFTKVRDGLSGVSDGVQLMKLVIETAKALALTAEDIGRALFL